MNQSRISFNVNSHYIGNEAYFLEVVRQLNPASITIMHGRGLAEKVLEVTKGETAIFYREDVDQDQKILGQNPGQYIKGYRKDNGKWEPGAIQRHGWNKDIRGYLLNEPNTAMGFSWSHIVWWLASAGYALAEEGVPAVIGNLPVGAYQPQHIEDGTFDPLLEMLIKTKPMLAAKGVPPHSLGTHEHTAILEPYGVGQWPHTWLLDKEKVQPENWPKPESLPLSRWEIKENGVTKHILPPYWHIRRQDWLIIRALEKTERNPNGIIQSPGEITVDVTELGADIMGDVEAKTPNVFDEIRKKYGIASPHMSIRGYMTLRPYYEAMFPQWTFQQTVWEQLKWVESIYPSYVRAFHIFTWSEGSPDWDKLYGTNVSQMSFLHQKMIDHANTTPAPPPAPTPNPAPDDERFTDHRVATTATGGANVRERPSLDAKIVGSIAPGGVIVAHIPYLYLTGAEKALAFPAGGFEWYCVRVARSGKQYVGWTRADVISKPVPVVIEPPPDDTTRETLQDWIAREKGQLAELNFLIDRLNIAKEGALALRVTCVENITDLERKLEETP